MAHEISDRLKELPKGTLEDFMKDICELQKFIN